MLNFNGKSNKKNLLILAVFSLISSQISCGSNPELASGSCENSRPKQSFFEKVRCLAKINLKNLKNQFFKGRVKFENNKEISNKTQGQAKRRSLFDYILDNIPLPIGTTY